METEQVLLIILVLFFVYFAYISFSTKENWSDYDNQKGELVDIYN